MIPRMTTRRFVVTHAREAQFDIGLRASFANRDLGIARATEGQVVAHAIRAQPGVPFSAQPHLHETSFQFVYVLKGWIEFDCEGQDTSHSDDLELFEIVMPAEFKTLEVASVNR
jgi:uncharacterized cupin superfamily protein